VLRPGPRSIVALLALALTAGCAQESPQGPSDPGPPPRTDLLRAAVRIHVDLTRGIAATVPADASS